MELSLICLRNIVWKILDFYKALQEEAKNLLTNWLEYLIKQKCKKKAKKVEDEELLEGETGAVDGEGAVGGDGSDAAAGDDS